MTKHRGLSTLVGAVFFIIAASSTVAYVSYSMNVIDSFSQSVIIKESIEESRNSESFEIVDASITNNKFDLTVQNTGQLPLRLTKLWVENTTDSTWTPSKFVIDQIIPPSGSISGIGQGISLSALDTQAYELSLVTERGNSQTFSFNSVPNQSISINLYASPEKIANGFSTTLFMTVTNDLPTKTILSNIVPQLSSSGSATSTCDSTSTPASQSTLKQGESVIFKWSCNISGSALQTVTFTSSIVNGIPGNDASVTVTIQDVLLALESGTSLESLGFTIPSTSDDILTIHQETSNTPTGEYQLSSGNADTNGFTVDLDQNNLKFITKNTTSVITIPAGNWNSTLNYLSSRLPSINNAILSNGMIFHFESNVDPMPNGVSGTSCDNEILADIPTGSSAPTWTSNAGVYSSGGYTFDGSNDYISVNVNANCNDIATSPNTTAGWFYPDSTGPSSRQVIFRVEESNPGSEFYEVVFDNTGNSRILKFRFDSTEGAQSIVQCASTALTLDTWHHFVAVRTAKDSCSLYVDGSLAQSTTVSGSTNPQVDINGNWAIGANPNTSGGQFSEFFKGKIDSIMHWETVTLSSSEVTSLYNTKYGDGAHVVDFTIEKVDNSGQKSTLISQSGYNLKFLDPVQNSQNFAQTYNVTSTLNQVVLDNERLLFTMNFVSGLGVDLRIDDAGIIKTSFVQIPYPSRGFPGYFSYVAGSGNYQILVSNTGTVGAFMTLSGIRGVFDQISDDTAYASIPQYVNGTGPEFKMVSDQDSIYLPPGKIITVEFYPPTTHPSVNGQYGTPIVPGGDYNFYIYLSGYDEKGNTFFKTIDVGGATVQ
jgi:hypothetical protein